MRNQNVRSFSLISELGKKKANSFEFGPLYFHEMAKLAQLRKFEENAEIFKMSNCSFAFLATNTQLRIWVIKAEKLQNFQFWSLQFVRIYALCPVSQMGQSFAYLTVFGATGPCKFQKVTISTRILKNLATFTQKVKKFHKLEIFCGFFVIVFPCKIFGDSFLVHIKGEYREDYSSGASHPQWVL